MADRAPRRIPGRLVDCQDAGQRANTNIRQIIRELARKHETNIGVIYAKLNLILMEVDDNDRAWERLVFETQADIKAENAT